VSVAVSIGELPGTLTRYPWGYLVTVGDDLRAHLLAVPSEWRDGELRLTAGARTAANAAARPQVTMVFPPAAPGDYSLIVDGVAAVDGDDVRVRPSSAVLHRPAIS